MPSFKLPEPPRDKATLRKQLQAERMGMSDRHQRSVHLQEVLQVWLLSRREKTIGAFWSIKGEFDALPALYREKGIRYIFDPGQQITALTGEKMLEAIHGSHMLVTNDYELELIMKATGRSKAELLEHTGYIITTLGENGSRIDNGAPVMVPAVKATRVLDPTGAGDAYRAGILKGLVDGLDVLGAARLGATCASFCVEEYGTQEHVFTAEAFKARHEGAFGA